MSERAPSIEARVGRRAATAIALALALFAALRVWTFAAGFPFFTNVDEHRHVDMVLKYARGYVSRPGSAAYESRMAALLAVHGSREYQARAGAQIPLPVWRAAPGALAQRLQSHESLLAGGPNLEAHGPPVYYALAGAWFAAGSAFGLGSGAALYWIRALNALAAAALVFLAYRFLRAWYPDDRFMQLGVPGLLACFPQDAFYYVTNDALSPLMTGLGLLLIVQLCHRPAESKGRFALAGALAAAAVGVKYTNLAVFVVAAACSVWMLRGARDKRSLFGGLLIFWVVAAVPLALWGARNLALFGSLTAMEVKLEALGWGTRALADWGRHPIFTPTGLATFVADLVTNFWRGELVWYRSVLAAPVADLFYTASTLTLLPLALLGLGDRSRGAARMVEVMSALALFVAVSTLVVLSLSFTFHATSNPPEHRPYFVHGRLISGVLLPFLLLYVRGLAVATARLPPRFAGVARWGGLAAVAAVALISEIALSWPVFASPYNWFHLP